VISHIDADHIQGVVSLLSDDRYTVKLPRKTSGGGFREGLVVKLA
jgi:hypothetical protein